MVAFAYADAAYPIPRTKTAAYRDAWRYVARPGSWWSGAERVAIAKACREARDCSLCRQQHQALSPLSVTGAHLCESVGTELPDKVVDTIHRIRTDPARLTRSWVEGLIDRRFRYGHYVEMLSIVVTVLSIDSFHEVLGLPLEPLPEPVAGKPDGYLPPGAAIDVAWVPMIYPQNLTEAEGDIYFGAPQMGHVIRAMSLVPPAVRMLHTLSAAQYVPTPQVMNMASHGELSITRPQIELVAARTSALNDCFY